MICISEEREKGWNIIDESSFSTVREYLKGQEISKRNYGVFNSPPKPTNSIPNLCPSLKQKILHYSHVHVLLYTDFLIDGRRIGLFREARITTG